MAFKPLSDDWNRPLGAGMRPATSAGDEIDSLPPGVFFGGRRSGDAVTAAGVFYKDGTGNVRRVTLTNQGAFVFAALSDSETFVAVGEELAIPELDPRAWSATRERAGAVLPELASLAPGSFFTALGTAENRASHRCGVYRLGKDGLFRRLLKDARQGLKWSSAISAERFGYFGQLLAVAEE